MGEPLAPCQYQLPKPQIMIGVRVIRLNIKDSCIVFISFLNIPCLMCIDGKR